MCARGNSRRGAPRRHAAASRRLDVRLGLDLDEEVRPDERPDLDERRGGADVPERLAVRPPDGLGVARGVDDVEPRADDVAECGAEGTQRRLDDGQRLLRLAVGVRRDGLPVRPDPRRPRHPHVRADADGPAVADGLLPRRPAADLPPRAHSPTRSVNTGTAAPARSPPSPSASPAKMAWTTAAVPAPSAAPTTMSVG